MVFITDSFFDKATIDVVKYKQKRGGNMYIVKVLVEHAIYKLDTTYDYLSKYQVLAGCRVHIRFGYQQLVGYVVECQETLFTQKQLEEKIIKVIPKDIVIGIGCRRNTDSDLLKESLDDLLKRYNIHIKSIKEIGSIDVKHDEKAILDLAENLSVPFKTVSTNEISKVDYLFEKSEFVKKNVGVYCVSEPVAYILSKGNLIIEKHKYKGITISVGRVSK